MLVQGGLEPGSAMGQERAPPTPARGGEVAAGDRGQGLQPRVPESPHGPGEVAGGGNQEEPAPLPVPEGLRDEEGVAAGVGGPPLLHYLVSGHAGLFQDPGGGRRPAAAAEETTPVEATDVAADENKEG